MRYPLWGPLIPSAFYHPIKGHLLLDERRVQTFLDYIRSMDNPRCWSSTRTMRHVAGLHDPPWAAEQWDYERCLEELERRKLSLG
jgi:hypothetical protein